MGFAEGFSVGANVKLNKDKAKIQAREFAQNYQLAELEQKRKQKQLELMALTQGYQIMPDGTLAPTPETITKQQMNMQQYQMMTQQFEQINQYINRLKAYSNMEGTAKFLKYWMQGKQDYAIDYIKTHPFLLESLRAAKSLDVKDFSRINFDSSKDLRQIAEALGINNDEDFITFVSKIHEDPNFKESISRSIIKVIGHDGKEHMVPIQLAIKATGVERFMDEDERKQLQNELRQYEQNIAKVALAIHGKDPMETEVNSTYNQALLQGMNDILNNNSLTPEQKIEKLQELTTPYAQKETLKLKRGELYLKELAFKQQQEQIQAQQQLEQVANQVIAQGKIPEIIDNLSKDPNYTINGIPAIELLKAIQGKEKIPQTNRNLIMAKIKFAKGLNDIAKEADKLSKDEWNAIYRVWQIAASALPKFGNANEKDIDKYLQKNATYEYNRLNAKIKSIIVDYIRDISGAAVTDTERQQLSKIVLGLISDYSNYDAFKGSIQGAAQAALDTAKTSLDIEADKYPYDVYLLKKSYLGAKIEYKNIYENSQTPIGLTKFKQNLNEAIKNRNEEQLKNLVDNLAKDLHLRIDTEDGIRKAIQVAKLIQNRDFTSKESQKQLVNDMAKVLFGVDYKVINDAAKQGNEQAIYAKNILNYFVAKYIFNKEIEEPKASTPPIEPPVDSLTESKESNTSPPPPTLPKDSFGNIWSRARNTIVNAYNKVRGQ